MVKRKAETAAIFYSVWKSDVPLNGLQITLHLELCTNYVLLYTKIKQTSVMNALLKVKTALNW